MVIKVDTWLTGYYILMLIFLFLKENAFKTPAVLNTNIEGVPGYDTKDLYIKHPTNYELWRIIGRSGMYCGI